MSAEDAELVKRYLQGEKQAVATVDSWITRAAYPYQRRLSNCWDDVLQNIRLEVTRLLKQGKFRGESSFKTYLWRVVSHTCLDQIRADSRVKWTEIDSGDDAEEPSFPAAAPENEGPGARSEVKDLLLRVLERVPAECRELWRMIHAGLSYREMSTRLGVAEGTLRVRVLRCRERAVAVRAELLPGATV
jgi:RNA polymerase sigma-70 factor (ECF subfamily)